MHYRIFTTALGEMGVGWTADGVNRFRLSGTPPAAMAAAFERAGYVEAATGQGDLVADAGGVEAFAGEQLVVEMRVVGDVRMPLEQACDLVDRSGAFGLLHSEEDAGGMQQLGEADGHTRISARRELI